MSEHNQDQLEQFRRMLAAMKSDPAGLALLKAEANALGRSERPSYETANEAALETNVAAWLEGIAESLPSGAAFHGRFVIDTKDGEAAVTYVRFSELGKRGGVYVATGTEEDPLPDSIERGQRFESRVDAIHASGARVTSTVLARESAWLDELDVTGDAD